MEEFIWLFVLAFFLLLISMIWSFWSLRDLKAPKNFYPKIERKMRKTLSGVIHLPKK